MFIFNQSTSGVKDTIPSQIADFTPGPAGRDCRLKAQNPLDHVEIRSELDLSREV